MGYLTCSNRELLLEIIKKLDKQEKEIKELKSILKADGKVDQAPMQPQPDFTKPRSYMPPNLY